MRTIRLLFLFIPFIITLISCGAGIDSSDKDAGNYNVLLIIIDTLRADHLGYWGYERNTTPTLDSLAHSGTAWMQTQAQSSWTLPSTASILTGLTPRQHGARTSERRMYGLASSLPTLQGILHSSGWHTCGIFNVIFLSAHFGFHRGFDHFDCQGVTGNEGCRRADQTVNDLLDWFSGLDEGSNYFAVVHFYDPHIPYDPPSPYDTIFADVTPSDLRDPGAQLTFMQLVNRSNEGIASEELDLLRDLYDGEIAFTDNEIGRLLTELREMGLADSTLVIITADHGEEFLEHSGIEHGRTLYQEVTHVPLIISGPGITAGLEMNEPAANIDILPTVLAYLNIRPPDAITGRDLFAQEFPEMDIPASNLLWSDVQQASIRRGALKVIWNTDGSGSEFFDLSSDPFERFPLQHTGTSIIQAVEFYWATPPLVEAPEVIYDEAETSMLRDLGYIR
jgi:arylsulfatase A-like enzyme